MELVSTRAQIATSFDVSLPHDVFTTLILLDAAPYCEGFSEWVTVTAAALPAAFRAELHPLAGLFRYASSLWGHLAKGSRGAGERESGRERASPPQQFEAFRRELEARPAAEYGRLALEGIAERLARWSIQTDPEALRPERLAASVDTLAGYVDALKAVRRARQPDQLVVEPPTADIVGLLVEPERLKATLLHLLTTFWEELYRERFAADLPQLEASVAYHRRQSYPAAFPALFTAVTGRTLPAVVSDYLRGVSHVVFVPSCHIGPYVVFTVTYPTMAISFNSRTVSAERYSDGVAIRLFPPLKALADETRLQIVSLLADREMYAEEIRRELGLSQPAASRHLQLLENTGVLRVRRANNMKYYSVDRERGGALLATLRQLVGPR